MVPAAAESGRTARPAPLVLRPIPEEGQHVLLPQLRRMPHPVVPHESDHPPDVSLLGSPAIVPQPELRPHESQEFRIGLRGRMRSAHPPICRPPASSASPHPRPAAPSHAPPWHSPSNAAPALRGLPPGDLPHRHTGEPSLAPSAPGGRDRERPKKRLGRLLPASTGTLTSVLTVQEHGPELF